jgi:hypothetical protein
MTRLETEATSTAAVQGQDQGQDEWASHLWKRRCATLYRIRLSVLYHLKRERFFDALDKACSMLTAVAATTAVGVLLRKNGELELWAAVLTAALSLVPLVVNPAAAARRHGQAASEFRRLLADCERSGEHWQEDQCNGFASRVIELEAAEPAPFAALVIDCENQLALAQGDAQWPLSRAERWFKHWWDFDAQSIRARTKSNAGLNA